MTRITQKTPVDSSRASRLVQNESPPKDVRHPGSGPQSRFDATTTGNRPPQLRQQGNLPLSSSPIAPASLAQLGAVPGFTELLGKITAEAEDSLGAMARAGKKFEADVLKSVSADHPLGQQARTHLHKAWIQQMLGTAPVYASAILSQYDSVFLEAVKHGLQILRPTHAPDMSELIDQLGLRSLPFDQCKDLLPELKRLVEDSAEHRLPSETDIPYDDAARHALLRPVEERLGVHIEANSWSDYPTVGAKPIASDSDRKAAFDQGNREAFAQIGTLG